MKIVFLGTPQIACGFLESILSAGHEIIGVISRPDKIQGRGLCLKCPPVKETAAKLNIPVFQPESSEALKAVVSSLKPDLGVAIAYGRFIKNDVLNMPSLGFLNVHFSLLPKYRGAAPVQSALINGEEKTGVTVFWIEEKMDTGPVQSKIEIPVSMDDDALSLFTKLSDAGINLLSDCLNDIKSGKIVKTPQEGVVSYASKIESKNSWLDFNDDALAVYNKIRGLACGPRAKFYSVINGVKTPVQIIKASPKNISGQKYSNIEAGSIALIEKGRGFYIKCRNSAVFIEKVQPEGKKAMSAFDFLNGARFKVGDKIANTDRV